MVKEKSWEEFRASGLLWFINRTLHMFGWAIVLETNGENVTNAYPARVKFRGFSEDVESDGYIKVSEYLKNNIEEINKESKE